MKKIKICFISSSGGHFTELKKLGSLAKKYNSFLITEKTENFKSDFCNKTYLVRENNRAEKTFIFHFFALFLKSFFIFVKERPNVIISTGALVSYPICLLAKIFRKKIIFIDSFARIEDLSVTGKKIYPMASLFFVQWKQLTEKYPKAKYAGNLFGEFEL